MTGGAAPGGGTTGGLAPDSRAARLAAAVDWDHARDETVRLLQELIRFPSVNPPGGELPVARHIASELESAGIDVRLLKPADDRGIVVATVHGSGSRPPVLLVSHTDVVPVEGQPWTTDPFGGDVRGGYVYGRGAFDDKGMVAVHMVCMLLLARHVRDGGTLNRDVIMLANADEESGGAKGMGWLLDRHPELVSHAACATNEGGRLRVVDGRLAYAAIQTAEKVQHVVRVTARGNAGHASVPLHDNAISHLARALAAIAAHREPPYLTTTVRRFFAGLAEGWHDPGEAAAMRALSLHDPDSLHDATEALGRTPAFDAVLRAGISPTRLEAGSANNVIPPEAHATLNIRTLPGQSLDDVLDRLRAAVAAGNVEFTVESRGEDSPESDAGGEMYQALERALAEMVPGVPVMPYLSTGATDSARLRRTGVQCYGLLPFPLLPEDEQRMHAADERVSVDALGFGTRLTMLALLQLCTSSDA